jgi:hypothetical protein
MIAPLPQRRFSNCWRTTSNANTIPLEGSFENG